MPHEHSEAWRQIVYLASPFRRNFVVGCMDWAIERVVVKLNRGIALDYVQIRLLIFSETRIEFQRFHEAWQ